MNSALAAVFVGGTLVGAFTVGFIESGIIAVGLTGFWRGRRPVR